jgi:hypothetical protein
MGENNEVHECFASMNQWNQRKTIKTKKTFSYPSLKKPGGRDCEPNDRFHDPTQPPIQALKYAFIILKKRENKYDD